MNDWLSAVAELYGLEVPPREDPLDALADMLETVAGADLGIRPRELATSAYVGVRVGRGGSERGSEREPEPSSSAYETARVVPFAAGTYERSPGAVLLVGKDPLFADAAGFVALYEGWPTTPPPARCTLVMVRSNGGIVFASGARGIELAEARVVFAGASCVSMRGISTVAELVLPESGLHELELLDVRGLSSCSAINAREVVVEQCPALRSLEFTARQGARIADCIALERLTLALDDAESEIVRCPTLTSLQLTVFGDSTSLRLEELGMEDLDFSDGTPSALHIVRCPRLRELALEDGEDPTLDDLSLDDCPKLRRVCWGAIAPERLTARNVALEARTLDELPVDGLRELDATRCHRLTDQHLAHAEELRVLRVTDVSGIVDLALLPVAELEVLDVSGCHGIRSLSPLTRASNLRELRAEGLDQLTTLDGLKGCPLDSLHLADCTALENIDAVCGRAFEELDLRRCGSLGHQQAVPAAKSLYLDGLPCPNWVSFVDANTTESLSASNVPEADIGPLRASKLVMISLTSNRWLHDVRPLLGAGALRLLATTDCAETIDGLSEHRAGGVLVVGGAIDDVPPVIRDWELTSGLRPALHRLIDGWRDPRARLERGLQLVEALAAVHALARLTCDYPPKNWRLARQATFGTWTHCLEGDPLAETFGTLNEIRKNWAHHRDVIPGAVIETLRELAKDYKSPVPLEGATNVTCSDHVRPLLLSAMDQATGELAFYESVTRCARVRLKYPAGRREGDVSAADLVSLHRTIPDAFDKSWDIIFINLHPTDRDVPSVQ